MCNEMNMCAFVFSLLLAVAVVVAPSSIQEATNNPNQKKNSEKKLCSMAILSGFKCLFVMLEEMDYSQEQLHTHSTPRQHDEKSKIVIEMLFWCVGAPCNMFSDLFSTTHRPQGEKQRLKYWFECVHRIATALQPNPPTERIFEKLFFLLSTQPITAISSDRLLVCYECAFHCITFCSIPSPFFFVFWFSLLFVC